MTSEKCRTLQDPWTHCPPRPAPHWPTAALLRWGPTSCSIMFHQNSIIESSLASHVSGRRGHRGRSLLASFRISTLYDASVAFLSVMRMPSMSRGCGGSSHSESLLPLSASSNSVKLLAQAGCITLELPLCSLCWTLDLWFNLCGACREPLPRGGTRGSVVSEHRLG